MTFNLQPYHIGEVLVCELLSRIPTEKLAAIECQAHANCTMRTLLPADTYQFNPNVKLDDLAGQATFDDQHKVDVQCIDTTTVRASRSSPPAAPPASVALEVKLGDLDKAKFNVTLEPSEWAKSGPPQVAGSLPSILNHRVVGAHSQQVKLSQLAAGCIAIGPAWGLILRQKVIDDWLGAPASRATSRKSLPSKMAPSAHIYSFDQIAHVAIGDSHYRFDSLVARIVGGDFAHEWKILPWP